MPDLADQDSRARALDELQLDFYAASSRSRQASLLKTVTASLRKWGLDLFPPTKEKVLALGATLKAGNYASAKQYLYSTD